MHLLENSSGESSNSHNSRGQYNFPVSGQVTGSITTDNQNIGHQAPSINRDTLDYNIQPDLSLESANHMQNSRVPIAATSSSIVKRIDRLALSSIINTDDINSTNSNFSPDLTLDEDAPHEEDDGAFENESTYISLPMGETYPDSNVVDSNLQSQHSSTVLHSWTPVEPPTPPTENKPPMPPPTRPASQRKRKRGSVHQSQSAKTPASSQPTRSKTTPRVKTAEQLATEALIEKENPHATKNELRSLKLRALHAVRIAERELNMPEAEKQRRLRLREYVRHKRAEERSQKNSSNKQASSGRQSNAIAGTHSTSSSNASNIRFETESCAQDTSSTKIKNEAEDVNLHNNFISQQLTAPQIRHSPLQSGSGSAPLKNQTVAETPQRPSKAKANKIGPKTARARSSSRTTPSTRSLEAEIKKQNPNASPTEIKSLKLRALHAERIAEREKNMSEKEKLRRHKLREYMRRRRDEERAERDNDSTEVNAELNAPIDVPVPLTSDSNLNYQGSHDSSVKSETPLHTNDNSICGLGAPPCQEETEAKEQYAVFSMVDVNHNNYHGQYQQLHLTQPPSHHINPLFRMPMSQSSMDVTSPYDSPMQNTYSVQGAWSPNPIQDPHTHTIRNEAAQKALHAAIQEASYMEPNHDHPLSHVEQHHEHFHTNGEHLENNRLAGMGYQTEARGDEMLAMMRARELAMIAAAAAEVEHAQQMQSSTSSHLH